jgi:hypothetical protein
MSPAMIEPSADTELAVDAALLVPGSSCGIGAATPLAQRHA